MQRFVCVIASILILLFASCSDDSTGPCDCPDDEKETRFVSSIKCTGNTYFFLDHPPTKEHPNGFIRPQAGKIDVYRSIRDFEVPSRPKTWGIAYVDTFGTGTDIGRGDNFEKRQFEILVPTDDYRFILDARTEDVNGIELVRPLFRGEVLAVAYVNVRGDTIGDYGQPASDLEAAPLELELIWPADPLPTGRFGYTWQYMMRMMYSFSVDAVDPASIEVEIHETANRDNTWHPEGSSIPWIRIFGLDQTDNTGIGPPDGKVDLTSGVIDASRGLLTFPLLTPFDPDSIMVAEWTKNDTLPDGFAFTGPYENLLNPTMYTTSPYTQEYQASSRFHIIFKFKKP